MNVWVTDTSPLIFLAHLDRLSLLRGQDRVIYAPQAVYEEIAIRSDTVFRVIERARSEWLEIREVRDRTAV